MTNSPDEAGKPNANPLCDHHGSALMDRVNTALQNYSDKDWNYSRISLITIPLDDVEGPYVLKIEVLDQRSKDGRTELKTLTDEVKWGERHSSELGMLEIVSLRINKALLETTSDDYWDQKRPIVRVSKKQDVDREISRHVLWYKITEVAGEEFDNR